MPLVHTTNKQKKVYQIQQDIDVMNQIMQDVAPRTPITSSIVFLLRCLQ